MRSSLLGPWSHGCDLRLHCPLGLLNLVGAWVSCGPGFLGPRQSLVPQKSAGALDLRGSKERWYQVSQEPWVPESLQRGLGLWCWGGPAWALRWCCSLHSPPTLSASVCMPGCQVLEERGGWGVNPCFLPSSMCLSNFCSLPRCCEPSPDFLAPAKVIVQINNPCGDDKIWKFLCLYFGPFLFECIFYF